MKPGDSIVWEGKTLYALPADMSGLNNCEGCVFNAEGETGETYCKETGNNLPPDSPAEKCQDEEPLIIFTRSKKKAIAARLKS